MKKKRPFIYIAARSMINGITLIALFTFMNWFLSIIGIAFEMDLITAGISGTLIGFLYELRLSSSI